MTFHMPYHALSSVLKHFPCLVVDEKVALTDQFAKGVEDPSLTLELCKYVRAHPESSLIDAYLWVKACRHMTADAHCTSVTANKKKCILRMS